MHSVVNLGGVVKILWRSNSLSRSFFSTAGSFGVAIQGLARMPSFTKRIVRHRVLAIWRLPLHSGPLRSGDELKRR